MCFDTWGESGWCLGEGMGMAGSGRPVWSVILHPLERETPSKTGRFDESMILDHAQFQFMNEVQSLRSGSVGYPTSATFFPRL